MLEEQKTVLTIILGFLSIISVTFAASFYIIKEHRKHLEAEKTISTPPAVPPQPAKTALPPAPSPESQRSARAEHFDLVERSLKAKFDDLDTFFTTKSLMESARDIAQYRNYC